MHRLWFSNNSMHRLWFMVQKFDNNTESMFKPKGGNIISKTYILIIMMMNVYYVLNIEYGINRI